ncbi:MAG: tetratricopeptide repeat protein [Bryobacteraceae bacterium]
MADTDRALWAYFARDWAIAHKKLLAAASEGEVEALYWLGDFYSQDRPPYRKDPARSFGYLSRAAEAGHPTAEFLVSEAYRNGAGVAADEAKALRWLLVAVEDQVPEAQRLLAARLESGRGVAKDETRAAELRRIADTPHSDREKYSPYCAWTAEARLALARGDVAGAARQFRELAARGVSTAQLRLGFLYREGRGVEKDAGQMSHWLGRASEHDFVAAYALAAFHLTGTELPRNVPKAAMYLERALRLGTGDVAAVQARLLLATIHGRGLTGRPDPKRAADLLLSMPPIAMTNPPRQPHPDSALVERLPRMSVASVAEQRSWMVAAARSGHVDAQKHLGHMFEFGVERGPAEGMLRRDLVQAYRWYALAVGQGDSEAGPLVERVKRKMTAEEIGRARGSAR